MVISLRKAGMLVLLALVLLLGLPGWSMKLGTLPATSAISCEKKQQPGHLKKLFAEFDSPPSPPPGRGVKPLHTSSYFASLTAICRDDSKVSNLSSRYHPRWAASASSASS